MINTQICLAILGFGTECSKKNAQIATTTGKIAGKNGISLVAGNVTSTFAYAFKAAKEFKVANICVIEKQKRQIQSHDATELYFSNDTYSKHDQITDLADAAVLIGGGPGSKLLLNHFIKHKKTVVAIEGTGGIVNKNLPKTVHIAKNITEAFKFLFSTKKVVFEKTTLGNIKLTYNHFALTKLEFVPDIKDGLINKKKDPFIKQIHNYFKGKPTEFIGRIHITGTDFQKSVWRAILDIPWGKTMEFEELASILKMENTEGAIGNAAINNPLPIIIPSHRLITKRGQFHGNKELQMRLLDIEKHQTELSIF